MDFRPTDEQALLRSTVREFAETEIRPTSWSGTRRRPSPSLWPKLAALGLTGIQFPEESGGSAMSAVDYCICIEELARVCPGVALSVAAHNGLCSAHIAMFGSPEQKRRFLPRLMNGEAIGAWGLTEAGAGSDAAAMRTVAVRHGDSWVINGSKHFITHGKIGSVMVAMAVTDRDQGPPRCLGVHHRARSPGMSAGKKEDKLGMRASDTSEVIFQDCRVPDRSCSVTRGRASSTRSRSSMPAGSGSPRCRSAWRKAPTKRRCTMPRSGGSSASRSPPFKRFSGSSRTTRSGSKRPGC